MGYTYYNPLKVWLDPASIADVVSYIQKYLSENPIKDTEEINQIIADYIAAHPEIIGGVQSVNGETGVVVLTASDIETTGQITIQAVLTSLSSQISDISQTVTGLDTRITANTTGITNEATARANADTALGNQITALQGAVGSPLVAATAAAMTDTSKIYVYTGSETGYTNGNWYYYNGTAWTSGGVYNAVAINTDTTLTVSGMAADAKATGDGLNELKRDLDAITEHSLNILFFTDHTNRTLSSGIVLSFEEPSSIEFNGAVGSSIITLPLMGNENYVPDTFQPNLASGTYGYSQQITTGSGDTTGTALYYRTSTSGSNQGFQTWSNNTVKTFETPVEIVYRLSANKTFTGRKCQITIIEGNAVPANYIPYEISAIDRKAREMIENLGSENYTVPSSVNLSTFFNTSAYASTHELQGVCTDGTYLYYAMHPENDEDNAVIGKIRLSDGTLISEVSNHSYGHCNGMCYFPDNNTLIISSMDNLGTMYVVDADTLSYVSEFVMQTILKDAWENYSYGSYAGVGCVGYSEELEKFVFLLRQSNSGVFWGFAITDKAYNLEKLLKCQNVTKTVQYRGGLDCDSEYIYMTEADLVDNVRVAKIVIYNYAGAIVSVLSMSGLGYTIEGVAKLNNSEYYMSHSNNVIRKITVEDTTLVSVASIIKKYNFN